MYVNSSQLQHASLDTYVQVELLLVMLIMMMLNSSQLQHASLDTAVQVALVMVMVIMKMMRRMVNQ